MLLVSAPLINTQATSFTQVGAYSSSKQQQCNLFIQIQPFAKTSDFTFARAASAPGGARREDARIADDSAMVQLTRMSPMAARSTKYQEL